MIHTYAQHHQHFRSSGIYLIGIFHWVGAEISLFVESKLREQAERESLILNGWKFNEGDFLVN